jgi:hypothetical protein
VNHLQLWIARLTAVLIADQLVDLWITSRWRWPADGPVPTRVLIAIFIAGCVVVEWVLFGYWLTPPSAS